MKLLLASLFLLSPLASAQVRIAAAHGDQESEVLGWAVGGLDDLNGDGYPEFFATAPHSHTAPGQSGSVEVYSGIDGSTLYEISGFADHGNDPFGWSGAVVGDLDLDGFVDFAIGYPDDSSLFGHGGSVRVFSAIDGAGLLVVTGDHLGHFYGYSVGAAGDVDADGFPDVIVGNLLDGTVAAQAGSAQVFSGASGALLYELAVPDIGGFYGFATSLAGGGDLDDDGIGDLLVGSPEEKRVYGWSGADGSMILAVDSDVSGFWGGDFGWSVDFAPAVGGLGVDTFVVGATGSDDGADDAGSALLYAEEVFWKTYCDTSPSSVGPGATIGLSGDLSIASNDTRLEAYGCPPDQFAIFYYGQHRRDIPFGNGIRCVGGQVFRLPVFSTGATGTPTFLLDFDVPPMEAGRIYPGSRWRFQCWYRDPAGGGSQFNFSDALEAWFRP